MIWYLFSTRDTQLPNYSEIEKIKENPAFRTNTDDDGQGRQPQVELSSDTMLITHVNRIVWINSEFRV
jgi:hypothetical protein